MGIVAALAFSAAGIKAQQAPIARGFRELDPLIKSVCDRDVVLLGEDSGHGAGRTTEVKSQITRRLVTECGFDAIVFESQFYDFLDFEKQVVAGTATRQTLADAIGALWSRTADMQPLIDFLFERAAARRILIGGMDPQVGGITGFYSQRKLGAELASILTNPERRAACEVRMNRQHAWTYDAMNPFDEAAKTQLRECGRAVAEAGRAEATSMTAEKVAMARAYGRYMEQTLDGDINARDLGMYENLSWHRKRWPKGAKVVVWCATSHAARTQVPGIPWRPLGSHLSKELGSRVAVIGFSAISGSFAGPGGRGSANAIAAPDPGSIESVFLQPGSDLKYVEARELAALGVASGRAISYSKPRSVDWSSLLDGLVLLREERAAQAVR